MMRMRFAVFVLLSGIGLNGCGYFAHPYLASGSHWSKQGVSNREAHQVHWECYARPREMRNSMDFNLILQLEIEAQNCMLKHGFSFKDAPGSERKMCSREYAERRSVKNYMVFPACQNKYGKRRR